MSTVFSQIIVGELPGHFVWKDDACVVFATIAPITPGHMLVVPRAEVAEFTQADDALLAHLMHVAKAIGQACKAAYGAPRAGLLIAGFEVDHLHLHVLPAWGEGELRFDRAKPATADDLIVACDRIRAALRDLGYGEHVSQ